MNNEGRDKTAYDLHYSSLKSGLEAKGIDITQLELYLRAFKHEKDLQVWVRQRGNKEFQYFQSYPFCQSSGTLGPKRKEGDYQTPEGFYHIDRFNPMSSYHLSLGINYPNASDLIRSDAQHPGSDIFIHGNCVTVGCIPITDTGIQALYTLADIARKGGQQQIATHIFPFKMDADRILAFAKKHPKHKAFWLELQPFYNYFESKKQVPTFKVDDEGKYVLAE